MSSQHRKHRGYRTERVVVAYLQTWWRNASIGRGAGKDIHNVPFDIEVKARADFKPQEWLRQVIKRSERKELSAVVVRMNNMGENASEYLAFMRFDDLVQLLLRAGYGDIQQDSVQLEPERCAACGSWKLVDVICRTCKVDNANL